jgi:hypothetical protein
VQVTLVNDADIPSTLTFDKLKLSSSEELEIEFPIGAKSKSISLQVTAKVSYLSATENNASSSNVTSTHLVSFNTA